jgi:Zn-dependent peptidase ImmA (M78 family)
LEGSFPKIREWVSGESLPTLRQLEGLARRTLTPLGFLFLTDPPDEFLPFSHFRTLDDTAPLRPSPELLETVWTMHRRQAWMREYLRERGHEPLAFVRSAQLGDPPAVIADLARSALSLRPQWAAEHRTWTDALAALRDVMEDAGIMVVTNSLLGNNTSRRLNVEEFRGFVLADEYAPLAFVNGADGKAAQMFTLAHELAHILVGSSASFDLREMQPADDPTEKACNSVAAEFLVPEQHMRQAWSSVEGESRPFETLARRFKVSAIVAARRALDLDLIDKTAFLGFYGEYRRQERRGRSSRTQGGDFYRDQDLRVGRRFAATVVRAAQNQELLYSEAFELTGLYGQTFDEYACRLETEGIR